MTLARDGNLSFLARSVAMYVWSHDERWQQSASAVAEALGMDRGTVGKALAELQQHGWMVREIHHTVGASGKPRTAWERWHLQMTNRPFSPEEVEELETPSDVRATPAPPHQTCGPHPHGGAGDTSTGGGDDTRTIEVDSRNAPEVHSSSARTDREPALERALPVEGTEAPAGADGRSRDGSSQSEAAPAAEQPAIRQAVPGPSTEAPQGLARLTQYAGSRPGPLNDPFSPESLRLSAELAAKNAAREKLREQNTPTTGGPMRSAWD